MAVIKPTSPAKGIKKKIKHKKLSQRALKTIAKTVSEDESSELPENQVKNGDRMKKCCIKFSKISLLCLNIIFNHYNPLTLLFSIAVSNP